MKQYLIVKWNGSREVYINRDGSTMTDRDQAEIYGTDAALAVAAQHGGTVIDAFDDYDTDDDSL